MCYPTNINAAVLAMPCAGYNPCCALQVAKAREQWIEAEGDVVDDCTVIVAFLDLHRAPAPPPAVRAPDRCPCPKPNAVPRRASMPASPGKPGGPPAAPVDACADPGVANGPAARPRSISMVAASSTALVASPGGTAPEAPSAGLANGVPHATKAAEPRRAPAHHISADREHHARPAVKLARKQTM